MKKIVALMFVVCFVSACEKNTTLEKIDTTKVDTVKADSAKVDTTKHDTTKAK